MFSPQPAELEPACSPKQNRSYHITCEAMPKQKFVAFEISKDDLSDFIHLGQKQAGCYHFVV